MNWSSSPLARAGESFRASALRRRRIRRAAAGLTLLSAAIGFTILAPPRPLLVWNASASTPLGLYSVGAPERLEVGDYVIARLPAPVRELASRRRYLPGNVPLVKRVAAVPGDQVCALGRQIFINGRLAAERRIADGQGRSMPWWNGCTTLRNSAHFLLIADAPASFDGRYFGPTPPDLIIGKAHLIWRR